MFAIHVQQVFFLVQFSSMFPMASECIGLIYDFLMIEILIRQPTTASVIDSVLVSFESNALSLTVSFAVEHKCLENGNPQPNGFKVLMKIVRFWNGDIFKCWFDSGCKSKCFSVNRNMNI